MNLSQLSRESMDSEKDSDSLSTPSDIYYIRLLVSVAGLGGGGRRGVEKSLCVVGVK